MDVASAVQYVDLIQGALKVVTALNLTTSLWPRESKPYEQPFYDYIVVGAGSAGCVIANRLTEDKNVNVMLIEAGGDPPYETTKPSLMIYLKGSDYEWGYIAEPDGYSEQCHQHDGPKIVVGKMLGGTSGLGYLLRSQGNYRDYQRWANAAKDSSWEFESLLPYFKKSEQLLDSIILNSTDRIYHGTDGYVKTTKDRREKIIDYLNGIGERKNIVVDLNGVHSTGFTPILQSIGDGNRQGAAFAYIRPIKDRPNLYVLRNTEVIKILFDLNGKAVAVKAKMNGKRLVIIKASKEIIVSCGTIKSAQLLMLSGIGPKNHLRSRGIKVISDLPVGKNFHDFSAVTLVYKMMNIPREAQPVLNPNEYPASTLIGSTSLNTDDDFPKYEAIGFINTKSYLLQYCSFNYDFNEETCNKLLKGNNTEIYYTLMSNIRPKSRGRILLRKFNNTGPPIIKTGLYTDPADLENLVNYIVDYTQVSNSTFFRKSGAKLMLPDLKCNAPFGSLEYWRCYARCMTTEVGYFVGTCALGSVVDSRLRVYGVKNLRVADASIIPVIPGGGTDAPTLMIGEKAADMIKADNK